MKHVRSIVISIVLLIAMTMVVSPASSQLRIRVGTGYRARHRVYYHRHAVYHHRYVGYRHHYFAYRHRPVYHHGNGVHVRLNLR